MARLLFRFALGVAVLIGGTAFAAAQGADPDARRKADLVTAYKILVNENILDSFGHVTVRSAKDPNIFLMPRAMPPALVTESDILEVRVSDSQPIDPKGRRVNGERYIHGEIYKARPDVMSVIHSHSQAVIPLSLTSIKLRPVVAQAGFLPPETPTFEIRDARKPGDRGMQVTDSARGAALARTLSSYPAALMRGHGEVVVGASIKQAVVALLVSEAFLYRLEIDPVPDGGGVRALTSYELASRLSYLLWSTMPDDTLFELAAHDRLTDPGVLEAQVTRMLADARSDGLVRDFFGQWLGFRALGDATLDRGPGWTAALQAAAGEEARRFVAEVIAGDAELGALFTTDVNFVDDGLAELYGLPAPGSPDALVRVVHEEDARAGLLGLAGLLAPMSEPTSSAPSARGRWILEHLLCAEVPPPPDSFVVPAGTPREQAEALSQVPACATCHDAMDHVGLGLEGFDQAGRARTKYAATDAAPIDVRGSLPDGTPFVGLAGLEAELDAGAGFFACASRNALTYALGRALTPADDGALASIDAVWKANGRSLRGLLAAIVVDDVFRLRNAKGQP